ncbi:MAG: sigma-70 family RNA polymerase sigma factor [Gemmatimonadaceae bacterium]
MRGTRVLRLESSVAQQVTGATDDYERLLTALWGPLVRYARGIIGSTDGAEDVVQEAFIGLWQRREPLAPDSIAPFLYRAVRNRALNERRWYRVRHLWRVAQAGDDPCAPPPCEEEVAEQRVRDAVAKMPRRRREVFELARYHDLTHKQIALTLSMAPQTVANHMSAALRDLRVSLADLLGESASGEERSGDD